MSLVLPQDLANEMRALLVDQAALSRFRVKFEADGRTAPEVVRDSLAVVVRSELWILHDDRSSEILGVGVDMSPVTVIDRFTLLAICGRRTANAIRPALDAADSCLREALLPSATGRIEILEDWQRQDDADADLAQVYQARLSVNYDDLMAVGAP